MLTSTQRASGTALNLSDPISTTITTTDVGPGGYGLWALNGGSITATTPVLSVTTANSRAINAESGGAVLLGGEGTSTFNLSSTNSDFAVMATGIGTSVSLSGVSVHLDSGTVTAGVAAVQIDAGARASIRNTTLETDTVRTGTTSSIYGLRLINANNVDLSNVTIDVSAPAVTGRDQVYGVQVSGGTLTGSDITINASREGSTGASAGLRAEGANSVVNLTNVDITGSGRAVGGVYALSGANVTLNGGTVRSLNSQSVNVNLNSTATLNDVAVNGSSTATQVASSNGSLLTLNGGSVTSNVANGSGVLATTNSTVNMFGTTVNILAGSSSTSYGLAVDSPNSFLNANGVTVNANGANLTGAYARGAGVLRITNGSRIIVNSAAGTNIKAGVRASGVGRFLSVEDSTISVSGTETRGVRADNTGGQITLSNADVTTSGDRGIGVEVVGTGSNVTMAAGSTVVTTGTQAHGVSLANGGTISVSGSSVATIGTQSIGLIATAGNNIATFVDASLYSEQAAVSVEAGTTAITVSNTTVAGNTAVITTATGGIANLSASNSSVLTGAVQTAAGGTTNFDLSSASVWTVAAPSTMTNLTLDDGIIRYGVAASITVANPVTLAAGGGTFDTNGVTAFFASTITGPGRLTKAGAGTLTLTGDNSYTGSTTIAAGTLQLGDGGTSGSIVGDVVNNAALVFNRSDLLTVPGVISGSGSVTQAGAGTTILSGANSYTGPTTVSAGALYIAGDQSSATRATSVAAGATLGGSGTIGGDVTLADGATLSPGALGMLPGTLAINGNLSLGAASLLDYNLGQAGVVGGPLNDLVTVGGDLLLDGTLNVSTPMGGSFDVGIYRIIDYTGSLSNSGLAIGTIPSPNLFVQTSVANQVNLINTNGLTLNFWDGQAGPKNNGSVNGGDGPWQNSAGNDNWTELTGAVNAPFSDGSFAVFTGAPGTVTVDNSLGAVTVSGMQFAADGYVVTGQDVTFTGPQAIIRVGDGTPAGAGYTATIDTDLVGASGLVKGDLGTLILGGANSYGGGTEINGGVLQVASDANLGAAAGGLIIDGGTLRTTADFTISRATTLNANGGTFETVAGTTLTQSGAVTGVGLLTKAGAGTLRLSSANSYGGPTIVTNGVLAAGANGSFSNVSSFKVEALGSLELQSFNQTLASLDNQGSVRLSANSSSAPGTVLTVTGDYSGSGSLFINTVLGSDNSPTDQLKVLGGTSGFTQLYVKNVGGVGAYTPGNGIELVEVRDKKNSAAGVFSLNGDYTTEDGQQAVVGGAYAYTLHHNGVGADATDGNWYLRSTLPPVPPVDPEIPVEPGQPVQPEEPRYSANVPLAEAYPQVLQALNGVATLQQRVGNRYWKETPPAAEPVFCKDPAQNFRCTPSADQAAVYADGNSNYAVDGNGVWGRIEGAHSRLRPDVTTSSTNYDANVYRMQAGVDGLFYESDAGRLIGGFNVQYAHAKADISSFFGDGEISADGYGIGGTLTWYGENGFYLDGQAQAMWYNSDLTSLADSITHSSLANGNNGFGYALSLEGGKRIEFSDGWSVTPQAQLVYSSVDFDSFTDPYGANVSLDRGDSLQGRLGVSLDKQASWTDGNGQIARSHVYGIANLYNEFLDGSRVTVSGVSFDSRNERLWGGLGLGGTYNWANDKYSVYGEGSVNTSLTSFADSYTVKGTVGFRVRF